MADTPEDFGEHAQRRRADLWADQLREFDAAEHEDEAERRKIAAAEAEAEEEAERRDAAEAAGGIVAYDGFGDDIEPPERDRQGGACPVVCLGRRGKIYYFLSPAGELLEFRFGELTKAGVACLFDGFTWYLNVNFPLRDSKGRTYGYSEGWAARWLMRRCAAAGLFDAARQVRGRGVWPGSDGSMILHCGNRVLHKSRWQKAGKGMIDGHYYPLDDALQPPADDAATRADAEQLLALLQTWNLRRGSRDARVLVGYIAAGIVAGLLEWRPHIWLIGASDTGKTTLINLKRELLGGEHGLVDVSQPTEAAVRQHLGGAAVPVLIDEIEASELNRRAQQVAQLVRVASRHDQAPVRRGSAGGTGLTWHIRAAFIFSSTLPPPLDEQDENRVTKVELLKIGEVSEDQETFDWAEAKRRNREGVAWMKKLAPALRRRVLDAFPRMFADCQARYEQALSDIGHRSRQLDQLGTLLACADLLLRDKPPTAREARQIAEMFPPDGTVGADPQDTDRFQCLTWLLSSESIATTVDGVHERITVGQLIQKAASSDQAELQLRPFGLAIKPHPVLGQPMLCVANDHRGLERIFAGSRWEKRVWRTSLGRLPGAEVVDFTISFAGAKRKATWLPLDLVGDDRDDGGVVPAAPGDSDTMESLE